MSFQNIIGQKQAIKILQGKIVTSSISSAYLFVGPEGVGKTLSALTFAKALNCEREGTDGCDNCPACRKIDHLNHPDVRLVRPEGNSIKIEQIRNLKREIGYKLYEGRKKVWILQGADKLTLEASNSLLKILEEPPPDTVLILIAEFQERLPLTIISRCEVVRFLPLSSHEIEKIVNEKLGGESQKVRLVARLARGRASEAIRLMEGEKTLLKEREDILNRIKDGLDVEKIFGLVDKWKSYDKDRIEEILNIILFWFRDLLILKQAGEEHLIVNLDRIGELREQAEVYSSLAARQAIQIIEKTKERLRANVSPKFALEVMGLRLRQCRRPHQGNDV